MRTAMIFCILGLVFEHTTAQEKIIYGDCQNGFGVKVAANKTQFFGNFQKGKLNGYGLVVQPDGTTYAGELKENACWGKGIMLYNQGYVYIGEYINNVQQGKGTLFVGNTAIVDGTWKNNQPDQVKKIETQNQNSPCLLGNCENGAGLIFKDASSFSCLTPDMVFEKRPDGTQYFGPRTGTGYMVISSKEGIYVGMGNDRSPYGIGGRADNRGKVEYGNWFTISLAENKTSFMIDENKPVPIEISLIRTLQLPQNTTIDDVKLCSDGKKAVFTGNKKDFVCYDFRSKSSKVLATDADFLKIAIASSGKYGAYCTKNNVRQFDLERGKEIFKMASVAEGITSFQFSPDDKYLVINYIDMMGMGETCYAVGVEEPKVVREFRSSSLVTILGQKMSVYSFCDKDRIYYKPIPVNVITSNNILFTFDIPKISAHNISSNDSVSVFNGWTDESKLRVETIADGSNMYFTTTLACDRIAVLRGNQTNLLKIKQTRVNKTVEITFEPEFDFTDLTSLYVETESKDDKMFTTPYVSSMNFIGDGNGLMVVGGNKLTFVDLRVKNPKHPSYSQKRKAGTYSLSTFSLLNVYPIANSNCFSFRTKDNTVYLYEVRFK